LKKIEIFDDFFEGYYMNPKSTFQFLQSGTHFSQCAIRCNAELGFSSE